MFLLPVGGGLWQNAVCTSVQPDAYASADGFTTAIVNTLKDEPGLLMFDMMNEPLCNPWVSKVAGDERRRRAGEIWAFIRRETKLVQRLAPACLFTIGYTTAWEIEESTALLFWTSSRSTTTAPRAGARANYRRAVERGRRLGRQMLQTETGCLARGNSYEMALQCRHEHGIGWILFNLMIDGRCIDEHGILYPDGTIRAAAADIWEIRWLAYSLAKRLKEVCQIVD
jgi:hypothetical protein